jgi:hypothetical protein
MRTVDFSTILYQAIQLTGLDREDFNDSTFMQLRDIASSRLRTVWESDKWPELITVEDVILTEGTGDVPSFYFDVPDTMGEIFAIYNLNPHETSRNKLLNYSFTYVNGVYRCLVDSNTNTNVYVEYRLIPPQLYGMPWDNATTYQENSQVYFDMGSGTGKYFPTAGTKYSGNLYNCISQALNNSPYTHPSKWQKVEIPYIFGNYLARAIQSDYLRSEGMQDVAQVAEQEANAMLMLEIDKITRQQGQTTKINFHNPY